VMSQVKHPRPNPPLNPNDTGPIVRRSRPVVIQPGSVVIDPGSVVMPLALRWEAHKQCTLIQYSLVEWILKEELGAGDE
jgi:hypothetical protein